MRHRPATFKAVGILNATALALCLTALGQPGLARDQMVMTATDMTFGAGPPFFPDGVEMIVLAGNPGEDGTYIIRLKFPAGYAIPPHTHSKVELVTIISGQLGVAMGDTLKRDAASLLAPGAFVSLPANKAHYAWADDETVVQVTGTGPFDITYVNPADDPRTN